MFNLIVSGSGWQTHRDSFGSGRVLEYTDTAVAQRFISNKVAKIQTAPTRKALQARLLAKWRSK